MKTFSERLHEIKNASRNETFITQLKRAGEDAVILEGDEKVIDANGKIIWSANPVADVPYAPVNIGIDMANGPDKSVMAKFDGKTFTILDDDHSVSVEIDTSTDEAKEAVEELEEIFEEEKDENNG